VKIVLVVPDPPPVRTIPGRSADRRSPNASPLAHAGKALRATDPHGFPIQWQGIMITFGRSVPQVEGYDATDAIIEVLTDVGVLEDPGFWWTKTFRTRNPFYVVTLDTEWID
jgi:hypothetical protein